MEGEEAHDLWYWLCEIKIIFNWVARSCIHLFISICPYFLSVLPSTPIFLFCISSIHQLAPPSLLSFLCYCIYVQMVIYPFTHLFIHSSLYPPCINFMNFSIYLSLLFTVTVLNIIHQFIQPCIHPLNHSSSIHSAHLCNPIPPLIHLSLCPFINSLLFSFNFCLSATPLTHFRCSFHPLFSFICLYINYLPNNP